MPQAEPMRILAAALALVAALAIAGCADTPVPVRLDTRGGEAWSFARPVTARVEDGTCGAVVFASSAGAVAASVENGAATARVPLWPGRNDVTASCLDAGTLRDGQAVQHWQVPLEDRPKAWVRTVPRDGQMHLDAGASEPAPVRFAPIVRWAWRARPGNPAPLAGLPAEGRRIALDPPAVDGEYYVTLAVTDAAGRRDESTGVFRVAGGRFEAVDLAREHPAWADRAVVYGVVPFLFGNRGFDDVTARLDDLVALGVTTLWLSPITATTPDDFGYAVTDHFRLRPDFGSDADFRELIAAAHDRGLRVIMDFVPNHVSAEHLYYRDAQANGTASPYHPFFDRDARGNATHYFDWENLINLDYDNAEVQRWIIEAFAHWVRDYDIDGFRADAVWGPRQRAPEFWARWRRELKRIEPDLLLLAEASARDPYYYENGFDAAYDWTTALGHWAWRDAFENPDFTARHLRREIEASLAQDEPDALVFRFLDNNDTGARFVTRYGVERTRLAAALLLTLPGLPQIYTGQEVGAAFEPYDEGPPISWADPHGLQPWYRQLIALRRDHAALRSQEIRFLDLAPSDQLLAYLRPGGTVGDESILVLLNWRAAPLNVRLPADWRGKNGAGRLSDLLSGEKLGDAAIPVPAYGVRILTVP